MREINNKIKEKNTGNKRTIPKRKGIVQVIINSLNNDLSIELISKITGSSIKE